VPHRTRHRGAGGRERSPHPDPQPACWGRSARGALRLRRAAPRWPDDYIGPRDLLSGELDWTLCHYWGMQVFVFQSLKDTAIIAFTVDETGGNLPADYRPWERLGSQAMPVTSPGTSALMRNLTSVGCHLFRSEGDE